MRMAPQFMRTWGSECRTLDAARTVCYDVMRALCVEPLVLVVRYDSLSFMGGNYWIPLDPTWVAQQIVGPHSRLFRCVCFYYPSPAHHSRAQQAKGRGR